MTFTRELTKSQKSPERERENASAMHPLFLRFLQENTTTVIPRCEAGRINNALVGSHLEAKQQSEEGGLRVLERRAQAPALISAA